MARNRLADVNRNYGEQNAPQATGYPPPGNGVIAPSRVGPNNPYAQAQGQGQGHLVNSNPYAQAPPQGNPYAQQQQLPPQQQYGGGQYGQQESYATGGPGAGAGVGGDFWSELTNTNQNLSALQEQIQGVRAAHQQSLTSTDPQAAAQVDALNDQAKGLREQCSKQIKGLFKMAKGDKAMKAQVETVKTRFTGLLNEHQVVEKEYRKKTKDRVERQYRIVNPQASEDEVRQVVESDNPQVFSQALLNSNRYGAARGAYREVQERHAEIQKIEKTLTELAQMFSEMAMLVEQQDETIINVEGQAQGVDQDISAGLQQTEKAVASARKARRKKWICFWIIIVIIAILAIVLGVVFGTRK